MEFEFISPLQIGDRVSIKADKAGDEKLGWIESIKITNLGVRYEVRYYSYESDYQFFDKKQLVKLVEE